MYIYAIHYHRQPTCILATPNDANTFCHYRVHRSVFTLCDCRINVCNIERGPLHTHNHPQHTHRHRGGCERTWSIIIINTSSPLFQIMESRYSVNFNTFHRSYTSFKTKTLSAFCVNFHFIILEKKYLLNKLSSARTRFTFWERSTCRLPESSAHALRCIRCIRCLRVTTPTIVTQLSPGKIIR